MFGLKGITFIFAHTDAEIKNHIVLFKFIANVTNVTNSTNWQYA